MVAAIAYDAPSLAPGEVAIDYWPIGGARELWYARERQVLIEGPAGTGKTIACLNKIHRAATKYAGMRALMVRKTQVSLKASALVTYQRKVLTPFDNVRFYGGSQAEPAKFIYPNGSEIIVGGMDQASKVMSTEYDMAYINEATDLTEEDWDSIDTRLRNYVMPYQQLIADCNPQYPTHWLNVRCDAGKTRRILSRHKDNPFYVNPKTGEFTHEGREYIGGLLELSGVRKDRLHDGRWVAAEGQIYEDWDDAINLIDRRELPVEWDRFLAIDFGYTNPFVLQCWALDPDGRMILEHEIYRTRRLVSDHAADWKAFWGVRRPPVAVIADHDAEDRATWEQASGLDTIPAVKAVSTGIQAMANRIRVLADGKPRLTVMRDTLIHPPDQELRNAGKPTCTREEILSYIWDPKAKKGEQPLKADDHGMDCARYAVMALDAPPDGESETIYYDDPVVVSRY